MPYTVFVKVKEDDLEVPSDYRCYISQERKEQRSLTLHLKLQDNKEIISHCLYERSERDVSDSNPGPWILDPARLTRTAQFLTPHGNRNRSIVHARNVTSQLISPPLAILIDRAVYMGPGSRPLDSSREPVPRRVIWEEDTFRGDVGAVTQTWMSSVIYDVIIPMLRFGRPSGRDNIALLCSTTRHCGVL